MANYLARLTHVLITFPNDALIRPPNVYRFIELLRNLSPTNIRPLLPYVHSGLLPIGMIIDRGRMAVRLRPSLCG